jgi:hypothetical protein
MIRDRLTIGLGQPNLHLILRQQKQKPRTRPETLKIKDNQGHLCYPDPVPLKVIQVSLID